MRPAKAIGLYLLAVVVLGALLAPWLYWFVQWLAANVGGLDWLARHPFKRVFSRSLLIIAIIGLWPLLKNVGIRSLAELGYPRRSNWLRQFLLGYCLGVLSIAIIAAFLSIDRAPSAQLVAKLVCVGLVVALIEETLFRGALQGSLQKGVPWIAALVITSALYSAVHFLKPKGIRIMPDDVGVWSGFVCIGHIFSQSLATEGVLVGFVSLFLAGLILGWAFLRTRALYISLGLHAGWVLANELTRELGGGNIIESWITWLALIVLWLVLWKLLPTLERKRLEP